MRIRIIVVDRYHCKVVAYAGYKANERPLYFTILPTASNAYLDSPVPGPDLALELSCPLSIVSDKASIYDNSSYRARAGKPGNDGLEVLERSNTDEERHEIRDIISRWAEPEKDFFRVMADDDKVYTLSWNRRSDLWFIEKISEKE